MNQNKKILLMVAGIGLLLLGFLLFMFSRKGGQEAPPVANNTPPATSTPDAAGPPPATTTAPPSTPSAPPSSMNAGMTPVVQPTQSAVPQVKDPFAGGPGRIIKKKIVVIDNNDTVDTNPEEPDMIPVYEIPNVNTDGGAIRWDNRGSVDTRLRDAAVSFGRSAGWIANDSRGRVVAYFETPNGGVRSATVDSVIDGYRVKAINIDEQYLLLVNVKTGIEEKMTMQGARRTK